jgi:chromosome segregation ATPase
MDGLRIRHRAILAGLAENGEGEEIMTNRNSMPTFETVCQRHKTCLENVKLTQIHTKEIEEHKRRESKLRENDKDKDNKLVELEERLKELTEENERLKAKDEARRKKHQTCVSRGEPGQGGCAAM